MLKSKKKMLIICLVIIICILMYFTILVVYKLNIIFKQVKAYNNFVSSNNYKYVYERNSKEKDFVITSELVKYKKDGKIKIITKNEDNYGGDYSGCEYIVGNEAISVDENEKVFSIYTSSYIEDFLEGRSYRLHAINFVKSDNIFTSCQMFVRLLPIIIPNKIVSEEYEGKDCYKLIFTKNYDTASNETIIYLDKVTFLPIYEEDIIKENTGEIISKVIEKYIYEQNSVSDVDVNIPDLSEYGQFINAQYMY